MTKEFILLLKLAGAGAQGNTVDIAENTADGTGVRFEGVDFEGVDFAGVNLAGVDLDGVMRFASAHGLRLLCKYALGQKNEILPEVLRLMRNREVVQEFLDEAYKDGFDVLVLKGPVLAECYAENYLRISGDLDLFVPRSEEKRFNAYLKDKGFKVEKRPITSQHGTAHHSLYGYFEIHVKLFHDKLISIWEKESGLDIFKTPKRETVTVHTRQGDMRSLDVTEHFLFIFLHMVKHILFMEGSLRNILDVNVFAKRFCKEIDWDYVWDAVEKLNYTTVLEATLLAGQIYMGFEHEGEANSLYGRAVDITPDMVDEFIEVNADIDCCPGVADEFHDMIFSTMASKHGGIGARIMLVIKTMPYIWQYVKKESFIPVFKRGFKKAVRLVVPNNRFEASSEKDSDIAKLRESFERLGLI